MICSLFSQGYLDILLLSNRNKTMSEAARRLRHRLVPVNKDNTQDKILTTCLSPSFAVFRTFPVIC